MRRAVRMLAAGLCAGALAAPAGADWLAFDMKAAGREAPARTVAAVEAVDSWFTTLATLLFADVEGLEPGVYAVAMLEQADCADAAVGEVYRRATDAAEAPTGALGELVVAPDRTATRTLSIKPDELNASAEKLTVTEMRGHALVFRTAAGSGIAACGVMPAGAAEPEAAD